MQVAVMFDYGKDTVLINGIEYKLDRFREWLLMYHPTLCVNNFIRSIRVDHKTMRTYDWMAIFEIAKESGYASDFYKYNKR